jgi:GNAT superfamily N-acetyltransferase
MRSHKDISEESPLLIEEWSAALETRSGVKLNVRPVSPDDKEPLLKFFRHVNREDLRFRFLSPVREVGPALARGLIDVDHSLTENFLAFDAGDGTLVATAMIAAEPDLEQAEVAITIRSDYKHRGVGWALLSYLSDYAAARGIKRLESIEACDNLQAIELELETGFTAAPYPGDTALMRLTKEVRAAAKEG